MRVIVGPNAECYNQPLKHDDVIVVPEFFCKEDDWDIYYKLIQEMRDINESSNNNNNNNNSKYSGCIHRSFKVLMPQTEIY